MSAALRIRASWHSTGATSHALLLGPGSDQAVKRLQAGPLRPQLADITGIEANRLVLWVQRDLFHEVEVQGCKTHRCIGYRSQNALASHDNLVVFIDARALGVPICCRVLPRDRCSGTLVCRALMRVEDFLLLLDATVPPGHFADFAGGEVDPADSTAMHFRHCGSVVIWVAKRFYRDTAGHLSYGPPLEDDADTDSHSGTENGPAAPERRVGRGGDDRSRSPRTAGSGSRAEPVHPAGTHHCADTCDVAGAGCCPSARAHGLHVDPLQCPTVDIIPGPGYCPSASSSPTRDVAAGVGCRLSAGASSRPLGDFAGAGCRPPARAPGLHLDLFNALLSTSSLTLDAVLQFRPVLQKMLQQVWVVVLLQEHHTVHQEMLQQVRVVVPMPEHMAFTMPLTHVLPLMSSPALDAVP